MLLEVVVGVVLLGLVLSGLNFYTHKDSWSKLGVPLVNGNQFSNIFRRMILQSSIIDYHKKLYHSVPDSVKFFGVNELRSTILYVKDLELVRRVLVKDFDHFTDRQGFSSSSTDADILYSRMLVNLNGQEWKDLRAIMTPTFNPAKIRKMHECFNSCSQHLANYLRDQTVHNGEENIVDFQDCFGRYTMDVIASAALGVTTDVFKEPTSVFRNMGKRVSHINLSWRRFFGIVMYMLFPTLAKFFKLKLSDEESMDFFSKIVKQNMGLRNDMAVGEKRNDFLQLILETRAGQLKDAVVERTDDYEGDAVLSLSGNRKDSAAILDDTTVIANCMLFFAAGAEPVETILTFAAYQLALHPEVQERLAAEVTTVMDAHEGILPYDLTNQLDYLDMVALETLRLHTPGIVAERFVTKPYIIPETSVLVPVGTRVQISIVGVHTDPRYYQKPNEFFPEHFTAEQKAKRHPYAFMPFGLGPRNCIATRFALNETKTAIAHLVYNFRVQPCRKTEIPVKISKKTFQPENGMWLRLESRR